MCKVFWPIPNGLNGKYVKLHTNLASILPSIRPEPCTMKMQSWSFSGKVFSMVSSTAIGWFTLASPNSWREVFSVRRNYFVAPFNRHKNIMDIEKGATVQSHLDPNIWPIQHNSLHCCFIVLILPVQSHNYQFDQPFRGDCRCITFVFQFQGYPFYCGRRKVTDSSNLLRSWEWERWTAVYLRLEPAPPPAWKIHSTLQVCHCSPQLRPWKRFCRPLSSWSCWWWGPTPQSLCPLPCLQPL